MTRHKKHKRGGLSHSKEYQMEMSIDELKQLECNLWERQPKEKHQAYEYFKFYLEMPNRKKYDGRLAEKFKLTHGNITYYSRTHNWEVRARAYDHYVERRKNDARLKVIEEMSERQARHAMAVETSLMYPVQEFINAIRSIDKNDIKNMKAKELYKMVLDAAEKLPKIVEIERKARGVPNEISKSNVDITSDGEPIKPMINISVNGSNSPLLFQMNNNNDETNE